MVASFAYSCKQTMRMVMFVNKYFSTISKSKVKSKNLSEYKLKRFIEYITSLKAGFLPGYICCTNCYMAILGILQFKFLLVLRKARKKVNLISFSLQKRIFDGNGRSRSVLLLLCKA